MKQIGIIGGLGPESTVEYYQSIIKKYQKKENSLQVLPELYINSINMYNIFKYISEERMDDLIEYLGNAARKLELLDVDGIIIAANTPHLVFEEVQKQVEVPMLSIVDAAVEAAENQGAENIGLLGTKFTMEQNFFKKPFIEKGKNIYVPDESTQQYLHEKIVSELENGIVNPETKKEFERITREMIEQHKLDTVILGCTELPMILSEKDFSIPFLDTMQVHVDRIVDFMFEESKA
ncbi:aspartate racemase [Marinococcus halophilus]|uniref:Aspartate racemase n=1 Tax=Marinococcus halophilus TaxID=1371 RepID=A0A510Y752_MARHA|nr:MULTISPECIES: amino acid racemase [Marinococcus]OZT79503.1 aspartate racemase [Marinococcus halophilus]GEK59192.1 aspartate racemase [Marinococcus halophilus]